MVSTAYREAYSEVLDILNHTRKVDVNKISPQFIDYLKTNCSKTYISKLNHSMNIKDMQLKPKTKAVLAIIYKKYWCDEEQRKNFDDKLKQNQDIYNQRRSEETKNYFNNKLSFQPDKDELYKTEKVEEKHIPINLTPYKESFFKKLIDKIKVFLKK